MVISIGQIQSQESECVAVQTLVFCDFLCILESNMMNKFAKDIQAGVTENDARWAQVQARDANAD